MPKSDKRIVNNPKLVLVSVGDRIRAVFPHIFKPEERERTGRVLTIKRRYGHYGNFVRTAPLLYVKIDGEDESRYFDQSFVVEVLEHYRGPQRSAENVFRGTPLSRAGYWHSLRRGVWQGDLIGLVCHVLSSHHGLITHPLDGDKLEKLFAKDCPGCVSRKYGAIVVKSEPFKRWVKQNYPKFLATTAELDADQTEENNEVDSWMGDALDAQTSYEHEPQEGSCYDY